MKKGIKNTLIGSGIAVSAVAAITTVSYSITRRLLKLAMDREEPKAMTKGKEKLMGSEEFADFTNAITEAASKLDNSGCEEVEIISHDGIRLVGHWHNSENAKRVIVAMHGWRSSWSQDFGSIADFWHDNNCSVLYAEQRGQNNSGGEYMGFGLLERYDCLDWIKWVNERTGGQLPIYLGGVSMGATTILMASGLELPDNVHGIVADSGFTSPHEIWKHVMNKNLHLSYGLHSAIANDMCKRKINMGAKEYSTVEAMKKCTIPVMFVHGTDDHFVPIEMTYENYKACAAPKRLFVVPGADHAMNYYYNKNGYEKAVKDFWEEFDQKTNE